MSNQQFNLDTEYFPVEIANESIFGQKICIFDRKPLGIGNNIVISVQAGDHIASVLPIANYGFIHNYEVVECIVYYYDHRTIPKDIPTKYANNFKVMYCPLHILSKIIINISLFLTNIFKS